MKKPIKIILVIAVIMIAAIAAGVLYITYDLGATEKAVLTGVEPGSLSDGDYTGRYRAGRFSCEVSVTIASGKITSAQLLKDVAIPQEGLFTLLSHRVIAEQSTDVDAVSGATVTSKAYLLAMEDALTR